ncbi:MAG: right-handed parallel beta-helix repeat-containing protein [Candidatus Diapherotrites archaeon]|uniref:Right-handed parallel beta-helix repeat-containing protein n=1 Tax=Candidatus Iainarchaeum sp. TaxID=3101447 RepID=A0A938YWK4_9ARCH|nr:right-handed parallel beta-helix repeat-containing protein [Candidatus Diapherotrites archaeon]
MSVSVCGDGSCDSGEDCPEDCLLPVPADSLDIDDSELQGLAPSVLDSIKGQPLERRIEMKSELLAIRSAIESRNAKWTANYTSASVLSDEERHKLACLPEPEEPDGLGESVHDSTTKISSLLPPSFDWRNRHGENYLTPVKSQSGCGSCWAFSPIAVLEAAANIYYNNPALDLDLSEQDLISCTGYGSCDGGWAYLVILNHLPNQGVATEHCFRYRADDVDCNLKYTNWEDNAWKTNGAVTVGSGNFDLLKQTIMAYGPVYASMGVYEDFFHYESGIYSYVWGEYIGGHAVTIVGWGIEQDQEYWIVKNSWSSYWGEDGYFKVAFGEVNIGEYASYAILEPVPLTADPPERLCNDLDGDNYCNWGISSKPDSCHANCGPLPDSDDTVPVSSATVLDQGLPVEGIEVSAVYSFETQEQYVDYAYTDSEGKAYFDLPVGLPIYYEIKDSPDSSSCLFTRSEQGITPFWDTLSIPSNESKITVSDAGSPVESAFIGAYGTDGTRVCSANTDLQGDTHFYIGDGFSANYIAELCEPFESGYVPSPSDFTFSLNGSKVIYIDSSGQQSDWVPGEVWNAAQSEKFCTAYSGQPVYLPDNLDIKFKLSVPPTYALWSQPCTTPCAAHVYQPGSEPNLFGCTEISEPGSYRLASDILQGSSNCISINASNVTLGCQNHTISGSSAGSGIFVRNADNVSVRNCVVEGFGDGITLVNSNNAEISENTAINNLYRGIYLQDSSNSIITTNTLNGNSYGLVAVSQPPEPKAVNNLFVSNTASNNAVDGFFLQHHANSSLIFNAANGNGRYGTHFFNVQDIAVNYSTACSNGSSDIFCQYYCNGITGNGNIAGSVHGADVFYSSCS